MIGRAILPFGTFVSVYLAFLLVAARFTVTVPVDGRLLTPLLLPILLMAVFVLDRLLRREVRGGMVVFKWMLASILLAGGLAHIGLSARTNHELTARALERGYRDRTYNTAYWDGSETVEWVKANPIAGHVYSNIRHALIWLADVRSVTWIGSLEAVYSVPEENAHIVWHCDRGGATCPDDDIPGLEMVVELSDGVIFRHTRTGGGAAFFTSFAPPRVGEPFGVALSRVTRRTGITDRSDWQWEIGSDAGGWTALPPSAKPTYRYTPTAPDIGHRLRARVSWTDSDGARVEAVTGPSEPVEQAAPRR